MTFDPDDFQDQAAIAAMLQRQRMINSLNQKQSIPENRKCPWCGGLLPGQYSKCQHCTSDVSWVDGLPCKPQEEDLLRSISLEKRKKQQVKEERLNKLKSEIAARVVNCNKCGCRVPQLDLKSKIDTCDKCFKKKNSIVLLVFCIFIAFLAILQILLL